MTKRLLILTAIAITLSAGVVSNSTTLLNATITADGSSTATKLGSGWFGSDGNLMLRLEATAEAGTTPTLDVIVQHSPDCATWTTLETFTQVGDEEDVVENIHLTEANTLIYSCFRVTYDISGSGADYTVSVKTFMD
jgi:hypothetical protein